MNERIRDVDESQLDQICDWMRTSVAAGGKVIVVGNGGSAAMASHVTVDLTKNAGIRAVNFNEADLLTCFANDYGYENWVKEALGFYADQQDTLVLISSSGKSPNILNGAEKGKAMGLKVATLSGFGADNPLRSKGDINLYCASGAYNIVEMTHHIWLLAIVDRLIGKI
jgi:D-sedoheptulose 7-phosphate isomerase